MASEPLIAIDDLIQPIPGDDPAGEPVPFSLRAELDEMRKEINPDDFDANDPLRPTEVKKADWRGIVRKASAALEKSSKDLLLGARLVEALTKVQGFDGFADGVALMRRLLDDCWDRLHPGIEDGDLEVRAGQFNWLGDDGRGGRFPYTLRSVPLFTLDGLLISTHDVRMAQDGKGKVRGDQVEQAVNATPREFLQDRAAGLTRAVAETEALMKTLNERLGSAAPGLMDLRKAVSDAQAIVKGAIARRGDAPAEAEEQAAPAADGSPAAPAARRAPTRGDLYARLSETADMLAALEPHSPVPFLVRRAVQLGALPFNEMMRKLMRPDYRNALNDMDRELGLAQDD